MRKINVEVRAARRQSARSSRFNVLRWIVPGADRSEYVRARHPYLPRKLILRRYHDARWSFENCKVKILQFSFSLGDII